MSDTDPAKQSDQTSDEPQPEKAKGRADTIYVKVYAPYKVYFEGDATSISAASLTGSFDILPKHHNFITLLVACDVVVRTANGNEEKIRIQGGIMHVKANSVIVFLDV
ncbi:MAG: F0F1 ATP synthase subunit epsilon [Candidatus Saccharimonadales bacterium]